MRGMKALRLIIVGFLLVVAAMSAARAIPAYADQPKMSGKMQAGHPCHNCPDCGVPGADCGSDAACAAVCTSFLGANFVFTPTLAFAAVETFIAAEVPLVSLSRPPPLQPPIL